jgi:hypothetical protein
MVVKYQHTAGRVLIEKDSIPIFDTDAFPLQFFPIANEITSSITVTFPDFVHANAYGFARGAISPSTFANGCQSFVTLPYQNWGPSTLSPPPDYTIATQVVGTVPGNTDLMMIRVNLTRTTNPSQINGNTIPVTFDEGQWVQVDGGAMIVEELPPMVRMIKFTLSPTLNPDGTKNVIMERHQSVSKRRYNYWRLDGNPDVSGWTYGGTRGRYGHIVSSIESKENNFLPLGSSALARGQPNACSLTDTTNYSSVFTGQVRIIPGVSNLPKETTGNGKSLVFCDEDEAEGNGAVSYTFNGLSLGVPRTGRRIIVGVVGYSGANETNVQINGVSVGGSACTLIRRERVYIDTVGANDQTTVAALYRINLPTGDTGNVTVTFSAQFQTCRVYVFAAYGVAAAPTNTAGGDNPTSGVSISLPTPDGGFAIAIVGQSDIVASSATSLSGIGSSLVVPLPMETRWNRTAYGGRGFQRTSGSALTISSGIRTALVAASFN